MMTYGELFAGVGGFSQGLDRAGMALAWQVELDPWCQSVLARHYPDVPKHLDVRDVGAHNLAPVDLITFGSPCQDLSVAGKRAGLAGERSGLFVEAIRIIRELRPAFALWENVPGALSSHFGCDFGTVLDLLADAGALDIGWRVLDARWFGVPQRRRRLFVVADFRGRRAAQVLFEPEGSSGHSAAGQEAGEDLAYALAASARGTGDGHGNAWNSTYVTPGFASSLQASLGHHGHSSPRGDGSDNLIVAHAVTTHRDKGGDPSTDNYVVVESPVAFDWQSGGDVRHHVSAVATSPLQASQTPAVAISDVRDGMQVRRLTPLECERLMGWEDDWTRWADGGQEIPDSHRYRMCGNGVVANVAKWIGQRMAVAS